MSYFSQKNCANLASPIDFLYEHFSRICSTKYSKHLPYYEEISPEKSAIDAELCLDSRKVLLNKDIDDFGESDLE